MPACAAPAGWARAVARGWATGWAVLRRNRPHRGDGGGPGDGGTISTIATAVYGMVFVIFGMAKEKSQPCSAWVTVSKYNFS